MPQNKGNSTPPKVMTWPKASWVVIIALLFDALRAFFSMFWLFGPAMVAGYCMKEVGGVMVVGKLLATGCVALSAAAGVAANGALIAFGTVMAMAIGLVGWLLVGWAIVGTNARIFTEHPGHSLWMAGSLLVSEVPLIDVLPTLTLTTVKMYRTQIKHDAAALKKYQQAHAAEQVQARQAQAAELIQMHNAQLAQDAI